MYCATMTGWHFPAAHVPPRQSCPHDPQFLPSLVRSTQALVPAQSVGYVELHAIRHSPPTQAPDPVVAPVVGAGQAPGQSIVVLSTAASVTPPVLPPVAPPVPPAPPRPMEKVILGLP